MKKSALLSVLMILVLVFASCATTVVKGSGMKGKDATMAKIQIEVVDYQGNGFGPIPEWVRLVAQGQYDASVLSTVMPGLEGKVAFVTIGRGDNLEFVKQWTDLVDVEVQVGDTIQRVVGKSVEAKMNASRETEGMEASPSEVEQSVNMYKKAVSAVELNGLKKTASSWTQIRQFDEKTKETKDYFEYYAVWTMDEKQYNAQLNEAMKNIADNTAGGKRLLDSVVADVTNTPVMISSNNEEINSAADDFLLY